MQRCAEIVRELQATSKRNEKIKILEQNKDNELWNKVLYFIYNPYIITGIAKKKFEKIEKNFCGSDNLIDSVYSLMSYLEDNNTGKDLDVLRVLSFIKSEPEELYELYKSIVIKDLQCGVKAKNINKAYGKEFIPVFDLMLAEKYKDCKKYVEGKNVIATIKLDGNRCSLFVKEGDVKLRSRNGNPMIGFVEIEDEAKYLPNGVYDGEIRIPKPADMEAKTAFALTNKIVRKDGEKRGLIFYCFDVISHEDFERGESIDDCSTRKQKVHDIMWEADLPHIVELPILYEGIADLEEIDKHFKQALENLEEGIMLNIADAKYQCKRTKDILKLKAEETCDLRVVDCLEGKITGTLGAFVVMWKGNRVGVGSGIPRKPEVASKMWEERDSYIGKIIEIQYTEESEDENGKPSLRFPRFKRVRDDKDEESYS